MAKEHNFAVTGFVILGIASFLALVLLYAFPDVVDESTFVWIQDFLIFLTALAATLSVFVLSRNKFQDKKAWQNLW